MTAVIALATVWLAIIAKNQLQIQSQRTAEALDLTREANEANKRAAQETAEYNRQTVILTHRPKVILRNVDVPLREGYPRIEDGQIWATNVGFTPATVVTFEAQWLIDDLLPAKNPFARTEPTQPLQLRLEAGRTEPIALPALEIADLDAHRAIYQDPKIPAKSLFLIGVLKYKDDLGQLRRTAFARRYNRETRRFVVVPDDDYEYAD